MPAFQNNIIEKIKNNSIDCLTSMCFCLEDSIRDEALPEAEESLKYILQELKYLRKNLPLIFIRVRSPEHLQSFHDKLSDLTEMCRKAPCFSYGDERHKKFLVIPATIC